MNMQISVGADPEIFLRDKFSNAPIAACGLIPGTKQDPFKVPNGAVQVDGLAGEFNIHPARDFNTFNHNIVSVLGSLKKMIPDTMGFDISPSIIFADDVLDAVPDEAKVLGCDPDFNAYTGQANPRPVPPQPGLRTASGHIHIGFGNFPDYNKGSHFESCRQLVKMCDRFLGCASVIMDPDTTRRSLYGRAGAFRPKPYGAEYRVPSNAWIVTERRRRVMYELVQRTMQRMMSPNVVRNVVDADVERAINLSDVDECRAILKFMVGGN